MHTYALGVLLLASLIGCGTKQPVQAPEFTLKDLAGNSVSLSSLRGHPILLDFWATWCGPCRMSIPLVQRFYQAHKAEGLVVLGMNVDEDRSRVPSFVKEYGISYPVLYAGDTPVSDAYAVEGIPTFYFVDKEGRITQRFQGFSVAMVEAWEAELHQMTTASGKQ